MNVFSALFEQFTWCAVLLRIVLAVVLGGCIGLERGFHGRAAGLRTHILVCIGACLTALTSCYVSQHLGLAGDVFRISSQVVSGLGFLGAGTIIVRKSNVTGLTTAAGLWATGSIGLAVGFGFYLGAVLCTAACLITVAIFTKFEINQKSMFRLYIELDDSHFVNQVMSEIRRQYGLHTIDFNVVPSKSQIGGSVGLEATFQKKGIEQISLMVDEVLKFEHITFVVMQ